MPSILRFSIPSSSFYIRSVLANGLAWRSLDFWPEKWVQLEDAILILVYPRRIARKEPSNFLELPGRRVSWIIRYYLPD